MATDVTLVRGQPVAMAPRRRMTRSQRRGTATDVVARLSVDGAAALEDLTGDEELMTGLPVLMGWRPQGRPHELRGPQLHDLLEDLDRLRSRPGLAPAASDVVAELRALVRRAVEEGLTLAVRPD